MEPMISQALVFGALASTLTFAPTATAQQQYIERPDGVVRSRCADWVTKALSEIEVARQGWHVFDADPLQKQTIVRLRLHLEDAPHSGGGHVGSIVPAADGSLQAEWHLDEVSIGLLVEDDGKPSAWVRYSNGRELEETGPAAIEFFNSLVTQHRLYV